MWPGLVGRGGGGARSRRSPLICFAIPPSQLLEVSYGAALSSTFHCLTPKPYPESHLLVGRHCKHRCCQETVDETGFREWAESFT
ncbi:hypothetical protein GALMADRAFT_411221 [Galerina marginata CBS 339.88]|uniref:Uncharacterized protein n=1 Tax=Galerina marginata (strain CBS 339.88) TaxID=685588 RepID=A0A067TFD8_GALM3|nr:hypothetical protein GALMADRAFT_411221 [Galerina marginata CBS 339.88]